MKSVRSVRTAAWAVAGLLAIAGAPAAAEEKAGAAQEKRMQLEEQDTIGAVLKRLEGRTVKLRLAGSPDELTGKVLKVGKDLVQLGELSGREFYDALIRLDQVSAVVVQARGR